MTRCARVPQVEEYLDGLLSTSEADAFRAHLDDCATCAAELVAMRRVFESIEAQPTWDPGPALTERILEAVLPTRVRRRWVRTVGWSYVGSLAASVAAALVAIGWPGSTQALDTASIVASRHLVQLASFVLNTLGLAALGIANGWGVVQGLAQRIAPLPRALGVVLQQPAVASSLWAAAVISVVLLVWLHRRDRSESDIHPLAILGVWS